MFDPWDRLPDVDFQTSLFADEAVAASTLAPERRELTNGAWVDVQRDWLPDPDAVFTALVERVPWHAERREMYDSVVVVPRLLHTYLADEPLPLPGAPPPQPRKLAQAPTMPSYQSAGTPEP